MSVKYTCYANEAIAAVKAAKKRALEICGGTAERYAKEYCPKQTGQLANSIAHEPQGDDTESIGTAMYYAPYVEFGHNQQPGRYVPAIGKRLVASHVAAKPYLTPALENHRSEYVDIVKGELSNI
jgi:phage gpG-like protein